LLVMEAIAVPLSFLLLVWVFGGLLAAALPLAVGMFAILSSMAVMRAITYFTEVSVFALNLTLALGLAENPVCSSCWTQHAGQCW
jgi:RND superfamily putative drug exporter